jgi:hypothetical protein
MTSEVGICNLALSHLGQGAISSLDENSTEAELCKLAYPVARDASLRDHPWNFAMRREALALLAETPPPGWTLVYQYPPDCLAARYILPEIGCGKPPFEVALGGSGHIRVILCNEPQAWLAYTARVTDTTVFDPLFVQLVTVRLAADLAQPLTGEAAKQQGLLRLYEGLLQTARASDANEGIGAPKGPGAFVTARR